MEQEGSTDNNGIHPIRRSCDQIIGNGITQNMDFTNKISL